ncbi:MAG TPA: response regulator transcription factor [Nitrospiraceae bacterium]|nr:response regulator transcription factor [Nitrospiraceae bacterium]
MMQPAETSKEITIAAVTKNHLVRLGLQGVIEAHRRLRLVGNASSERQAETVISREKPDVIVVEISAEFDVRSLIGRIKGSVPRTKIILLSDFAMNQGTWETLASEVDAMVLTCQPPSVLVASIDYAVSTGTRSAQSVTVTNSNLVQKPSAADPPADGRSASVAWASPLTNRERDIIMLAGQGLSNKDIADRLCIACTTVRHHLTHIFDKLNVTSRQQLLIRAHQHGLVDFRFPA